MISKENILIILLDSVFVLAFNVLFFVNGGSVHTTDAWVCYGFLHFIYLIILLSPIFSLRKREVILSKTTIYSISICYFFVELAISVAVFIFKIEKTKLVISVQVIITAIFFVVFITNLLVDASIEKKQIRYDAENNFIKQISSQLKYIETLVSENPVKTKINGLCYLAHSSPAKSNSAFKEVENEILTNIALLEKKVVQKDIEEILNISVEIERLLNKRNLTIRAEQ